jgi:hypothetical protein
MILWFSSHGDGSFRLQAKPSFLFDGNRDAGCHDFRHLDPNVKKPIIFQWRKGMYVFTVGVPKFAPWGASAPLLEWKVFGTATLSEFLFHAFLPGVFFCWNFLKNSEMEEYGGCGDIGGEDTHPTQAGDGMISWAMTAE